MSKENGITSSTFTMPEDIAVAEEKQQRHNEGKRLAIIALKKVSDGVSPQTALVGLNANELSCLFEAAVNSSNIDRILELENKVRDLQGELKGATFKYDSLQQMDFDRETTLRDDLDAAMRVIRVLSSRS